MTEQRLDQLQGAAFSNFRKSGEPAWCTDSCHQGVFARNFYLGQQIPLAGVAHQNGTLRFGHDPAHSVLDVNCKAHDVDNLYVVGASFFPSSAAVNPALTVTANSLRVGDHLNARLGR